MHNHLFIKSFNTNNFEEMGRELSGIFNCHHDSDFLLLGLQKTLIKYEREILRFYRMKAREELNKAQRQFDFVKDL